MNQQGQYCVFSTVWGDCGFAVQDGRINRVCLPCEEAMFVEKTLTECGSLEFVSGLMQPVQHRIQAYFRGEPVSFKDVLLCETGQSPFCRHVYRALRRVSPGTTVNYAELASRAGHDRAARAVGRAMAINPTPLLVPCHRVVTASGGLGGFSARGGVAVKKRLLAHERAVFLPDGVSSDEESRSDRVSLS